MLKYWETSGRKDLVGTLDRFNAAKRAECEHRVKHGVIDLDEALKEKENKTE